MLKFHFLFQLAINQDEFSYLSKVYKYSNGSHIGSLNSFHVHFFSWLSIFGSNEVVQVIAARMVMYLFFLGVCFYLFLIARYYLDITSALFSLLCYLSFVFTVANGSSFRHHSIATFFFLFALYLFLEKKESIIYNVAAGLAIAIAMVFTIKSTIHLAVFGGLIVMKLLFSRNFYKILVPVSGFIFAFLFGFIILYKLHIAAFPDSSIASQVHATSSAYSTFVVTDQFFPQFKIFKLLLSLDWTIWSFLSSGTILLIIDCARKKSTFENSYLFALLIPLFSILIYRNAFPYFYVFAIPTATIFCGYLLRKLTYRIKLKQQIICFAIVLTFGGVVFKNFVTYYSTFYSKQINVQHKILDVIHKMFPDPVPYIDGCFMVSSFPDSGFFMSSAGMERYLKKGEPIMEKLLTLKNPRFLLANVPHLNLHSDDPAKSYTGLSFMTDDWQTLKSYFIHHWGPIWVAGKRFEFKRGNENHRFKITVPGLYTVEGNQNLLIDGRLIQAEDVVKLETGNHIIKNKGSPGLTSLKWGENLYRPAEKPVFDRIFMGPFL